MQRQKKKRASVSESVEYVCHEIHPFMLMHIYTYTHVYIYIYISVYHFLALFLLSRRWRGPVVQVSSQAASSCFCGGLKCASVGSEHVSTSLSLFWDVSCAS